MIASRSDPTCLALLGGAAVPVVDTAVALADAVRDLLRRAAVPKTRQDLRAELRVNNERLGQCLTDLEARGLLPRSARLDLRRAARRAWRPAAARLVAELRILFRRDPDPRVADRKYLLNPMDSSQPDGIYP